MPFTRKLTDAQVRALLVDYDDGIRVFQLEKKYEISNRTIMRILADAEVKRSKGPKRKRIKNRREKKPRVLKPCGTNAAYQRHKRKGEYPCELCLGAHTRDNKEYLDAQRTA